MHEQPGSWKLLRLALLMLSGAALRIAPFRRPKSSRAATTKLLLIRPDHLGDVLLSTPAVEIVRRALPSAHLAMMVGPWAAEMARRDPLLNEVLVCPFPGFTRAPKGSLVAPYRLLWRSAAQLRPCGYDAAVVLRFDHWWGAWLAALAGIPVRVGHRVAECVPFLTHWARCADRDHWVERGLHAAELLLKVLSEREMARGKGLVDDDPTGQQLEGQPRTAGRYTPPLRFAVGEEDEREAARIWNELGLPPKTVVVAFHPGAGSRLKLWPQASWVELGRILAGRGARLLVTGTTAEAADAELIAASVPNATSLAGKTSLGALAALFQKCNLVVGVDNGPLHLAVAMGTPTVQMFGPTDPAVFGPWGDPVRHRTVASEWKGAPCGRLDLAPPWGDFAPCMEAIATDRVAAECQAVLGL